MLTGRRGQSPSDRGNYRRSIADGSCPRDNFSAILQVVLRVADLGRLRAKVMPRKVRRYDTAAGNLITSWRTLTIVSTCIAIASLATLATVVSIKR